MTTPDSKNYELVCGMEVHAELKTNSKMFCGCKNDPFGAPEPNIYTCPTCMGMPGGLPVANKKAIEWTIKLGLALGCKINLFSKFDRKNYFYPDLPKAYQISQFDIPFCYEGTIETSEGPIRITRIHLEEDTGKLQHKNIDGKKVSLLDYNRSSVPLIEIVTEPDIHSTSQAKEYAKKLRQIIRYLDIADCDMDQGGMRLEANISLREVGTTELPNYKVEVKNINSFRFMEQAIAFEMDRHQEILEAGETPPQETRGWNPTKNETFAQRMKEEAADYRYFPDPDLAPVRFTQKQVDAIGKQLPELPNAKQARWLTKFGIETKYSDLLTSERTYAEWLETVFAQAEKPNDIANALVNKKITISEGEAPAAVIKKVAALTQTDDVDSSELLAVIQEVMKANNDAVAKFRAGDTKVIGFFIGQVMRALGKKVDAAELRNALMTELKK
ncbi:MAG: Asp-tRNA(Asn)/Glu-tRNA(Gln) amidotransferase subunit GatB [Candidatus Pacebacteria bacterium]|nr:Asp-tRNA(Asn)/Glu-tRNA(Gln) amidotransferase subunit GatB [Candidatus Paceibacterota bacterium]PIR63759.1 MAG: Asp-tRNA(Asn)/Glu-tRNA(Gln) amidotransferase GatCAB subunit B [Candidatus Pacebacteria bacterium CG10_big_fil_rev_8_21_14_0_10_40_26]PIY78998.1 MAG: Asp-tRNA(Asn)/Glu-tRNA(Gln) amidotransferase GatCAB subunit B [Candidatus Pacebacteria bacterium CG_4_10_14_0_8_um_filter_43_12]PIZ78545.1 MAG: Asp-tRNA(Asn)/Glu-tRNA(Gln) amidotransferase GatCAB subunit B [Candidatus Pacebacteria bacter